MGESELRVEAMRLAISHQPVATAQQRVDAAEVFFRFLTNRHNPPEVLTVYTGRGGSGGGGAGGAVRLGESPDY